MCVVVLLLFVVCVVWWWVVPLMEVSSMVDDLKPAGSMAALDVIVADLKRTVKALEERLLIVERSLDLLQSAVDSHLKNQRGD